MGTPLIYPYNGNLTWLRDRTILLCTHGSHAYGLNTATSDVDIKGVAVAPAEYYHGFDKRFEQSETKNPDMVVYEVQKFFSLAANCNPNIIEVLWTEPDRVITPLGQKLIDHRDDFISKRARYTFSGYAVSQLERIQTHRRWLLNPPKGEPKREDFGLTAAPVIKKDQYLAANSIIEKKLQDWHLDNMSEIPRAERIRLQRIMVQSLAEMKIGNDDQYLAAGRVIGYSENFLELLKKERQFRAAKTDWKNFCDWQIERNPARAELERKFGFDTKCGMHLFRLMRMCREIMETGQVRVLRTDDREEILAIRNGAWTADQLIEWAAKQDAELDEVYERSTLRHSSDRVALSALCQEIVESKL